MGSLFYSHEFKRAKGELFHQRGREVWLLPSGAVTVNRQGKQIPFGMVKKDSIEPSKIVEVKIWDDIKFSEFRRKEAVKEKMQQFKKRTITNVKS